jgi:hypothetical protein
MRQVDASRHDDNDPDRQVQAHADDTVQRDAAGGREIGLAGN